MENTSGKMDVFISVSGYRMICMDKEFIVGQMVGPIQVAFSRIKDMVMEFIPTQIIVNIEVTLEMDYSMELEHL